MMPAGITTMAQAAAPAPHLSLAPHLGLAGAGASHAHLLQGLPRGLLLRDSASGPPAERAKVYRPRIPKRPTTVIPVAIRRAMGAAGPQREEEDAVGALVALAGAGEGVRTRKRPRRNLYESESEDEAEETEPVKGEVKVEHAAAPPPVLEKEFWIQCDDCQRWRRVPQPVIEEVGEAGAWVCRDHPTGLVTCEMPEEAEESAAEEVPGPVGTGDACADGSEEPETSALDPLFKAVAREIDSNSEQPAAGPGNVNVASTPGAAAGPSSTCSLRPAGGEFDVEGEPQPRASSFSRLPQAQAHDQGPAQAPAQLAAAAEVQSSGLGKIVDA